MAEAIESERRQAAAALDWGEIDAELHDVEWLEDYREQRFYPLKQVVDIFSSGDPEGLTLEVREPSCWPAPAGGRAWGWEGGSNGGPTSNACLPRCPCVMLLMWHGACMHDRFASEHMTPLCRTSTQLLQEEKGGVAHT